jgi:hypothetical protein
MKYIDYQDYKGINCANGGIIESLRLLRKRSYKKHYPFAILNLNRLSTKFTDVGIVKENGKCMTDIEFKEWIRHHEGLKFIQLVYRMNCGFGHYMALVIEGKNVYLFNSSPMYADAVNLRQTLKSVMPKFGLKYAGTVFHRVGFLWRRQLQIKDTCSVWVALSYHILASNPSNPWNSLKIFLGKNGDVQRKILHEFHKDVLNNKPFSFEL